MHTSLRSASSKALSKAPTTRQRAGWEKGGESWLERLDECTWILAILDPVPLRGPGLWFTQAETFCFLKTNGKILQKHRYSWQAWRCILITKPCKINKSLKGIMRSYISLIQAIQKNRNVGGKGGTNALCLIHWCMNTYTTLLKQRQKLRFIGKERFFI